MPDLLFPQSADLQAIAQDKMPRLIAPRPVFDIFPIVEKDAYLVMWEQQDNYLGLQQIRGLNGEPQRVIKIGARRYQIQPGVYGEFVPIDEFELTTRRQWGSFSQPIDITDLVMQAQDQLLLRRLDRIEANIWNLLVNGTFSVYGPSGSLLVTDTYTTQTFAASTGWSTAASSTPLADFRAVQLLNRGRSVAFNAQSKAYMNRVTWNNMLNNTNAADLGDRRVTGFNTINGPDQMNQVLSADDLPNIVIYDEGFLEDVGQSQTITITGTPTGGTFTVRINGVTSGAINYNAAASAVQTAIAAMSNIGTGNVSVSGGPGPGTAWVVTFLPPLESATMPLMVAFSSLTGGSSPAIAVTATTLAFAPFIPNGKVVIVGQRPAGQSVGEFVLTRNANNPGLAPGAYQKVVDHGEHKVPRLIEVHDGFNGGPALFYPGAVVVMTV